MLLAHGLVHATGAVVTWMDCAITSSRIPIRLIRPCSRLYVSLAILARSLHFAGLSRLSGEQTFGADLVSVTLPAMCPPHSFPCSPLQQVYPLVDVHLLSFLLTLYFVIFLFEILDVGPFDYVPHFNSHSHSFCIPAFIHLQSISKPSRVNLL